MALDYKGRRPSAKPRAGHQLLSRLFQLAQIRYAAASSWRDHRF
jgi:hypothetical protein